MPVPPNDMDDDGNKTSFIKAINFIYQNIDEPIQLDDVAKAAGLSLSSLKRLFVEITNKSTGSFIRHLRMELAFRSLQNKSESVLEIALDSGFENHSAFSRCFKKMFGYSPIFVKKRLNILGDVNCVVQQKPEIMEIKHIQLQAVTKQGVNFNVADEAWCTLQEKLDEHELHDDFSGTFVGVPHEQLLPAKGASEQIRFSAGVTFLDRDLGIERIAIPGGTYAKFYYSGKPTTLGLAYHYIYPVYVIAPLYNSWLDSAKIKINDAAPAFIVFDKFPDGLQDQNFAIYIPLRSIQRNSLLDKNYSGQGIATKAALEKV